MISSITIVIHHTRPASFFILGSQAALTHLESIIYNPFDPSQKTNGVEVSSDDEKRSEDDGSPHR